MLKVKKMEKIQKFSDEEKLEISGSVGLAKIAKELLEYEKGRLLREERRSLSLSKIISNLVIEKYGNA